ncbi:DNA-binding protein [Odoribacter sp. OttesenSCG-928-J03]|nr:DNA-binding protein [Odoribacter sp. OttesenSCG-928-J03]MDL2282927.1 DNA-binding protein [Odoribacter sp. OttesenSCG-928-G04]MDL2330893.1 DNA-binding protein [Odoribacter sp. OttesenSCG-928-A06]
MTTMTFNELRQIKDSLPSGSMQRIADELGIDVETVRNYFGGSCGPGGEPVGIHFEQGPQGGMVQIDDTTILEKAKAILANS